LFTFATDAGAHFYLLLRISLNLASLFFASSARPTKGIEGEQKVAPSTFWAARMLSEKLLPVIRYPFVRYLFRNRIRRHSLVLTAVFANQIIFSP